MIVLFSLRSPSCDAVAAALTPAVQQYQPLQWLAIRAGGCGKTDTPRQRIGGVFPQCGNCHIEAAAAGLDRGLANEGGPSCAEIVY